MCDRLQKENVESLQKHGHSIKSCVLHVITLHWQLPHCLLLHNTELSGSTLHPSPNPSDMVVELCKILAIKC